jgi:translocation and assembly module TamA
VFARRRLLHGLLLGAIAGAGCAGEKAEGRPWIHAVRVSGMHHASRRQLKNKLGVQASMWGPLAPKRYLDEEALPLERERVLAFYRGRGYFDAKVPRAEAVTRKDGKSVDVEITVEEGEPSRIAAVRLEGADELGPLAKRVRRMVGRLKPGEVFEHEQYVALKDRLDRVLHERGYAWAEIAGDVQVDRDAHRVEVALTLKPGPKARFGTVTVETPSRVGYIYIVRAADLREGAPFAASDLEAARARIYNTGAFSSVRLLYDHDPADPSRANVRIQVADGPLHELRLGGGFGIEGQRNDVHLLFGYTKRNFLGGLRTLQLRVLPAFVAIPAFWNPQRYGPAATTDATFTQPFLFGVRTLELKWLVGYDLGIDYAYQYHGPRTQLGVTWSLWRRRIQLGLSYNFQLALFFATDPQILNDPAQAGLLFGYTNPYRVGWWQQDATLDLRDHPLDPHEGFFTTTTLEEGGIYAGGAFQYEKIVPDVRGYVPMGRRVTLALRAQFGQIFTQGDLGSPITRRLYLGGPSSHRGFTYNRLSYQVPSGNEGVPPLPIGGDQMLLLQAELRVRIVRIAGNWFGAAAFVDAGDVTAPRCQGGACPGVPQGALNAISFTQLHTAVGGGLRYKTVIGTIRAEIGVRLNRLGDVDPASGKPPNPDPGSRLAFHISVGEAF